MMTTCFPNMFTNCTPGCTPSWPTSAYPYNFAFGFTPSLFTQNYAQNYAQNFAQNCGQYCTPNYSQYVPNFSASCTPGQNWNTGYNPGYVQNFSPWYAPSFAQNCSPYAYGAQTWNTYGNTGFTQPFGYQPSPIGSWQWMQNQGFDPMTQACQPNWYGAPGSWNNFYGNQSWNGWNNYGTPSTFWNYSNTPNYHGGMYPMNFAPAFNPAFTNASCFPGYAWNSFYTAPFNTTGTPNAFYSTPGCFGTPFTGAYSNYSPNWNYAAPGFPVNGQPGFTPAQWNGQNDAARYQNAAPNGTMNLKRDAA